MFLQSRFSTGHPSISSCNFSNCGAACFCQSANAAMKCSSSARSSSSVLWNVCCEVRRVISCNCRTVCKRTSASRTSEISRAMSRKQWSCFLKRGRPISSDTICKAARAFFRCFRVSCTGVSFASLSPRTISSAPSTCFWQIRRRLAPNV